MKGVVVCGGETKSTNGDDKGLSLELLVATSVWSRIANCKSDCDGLPVSGGC